MKMEMTKISDVKTYSGYKTDERPLSFSYKGKTVSIVKTIVTKYLELNSPDRIRRVQYEVIGDDNISYYLLYDVNRSEWFAAVKKG